MALWVEISIDATFATRKKTILVPDEDLDGLEEAEQKEVVKAIAHEEVGTMVTWKYRVQKARRKRK